MASENLNAPTPPVGVIESLTQGFETVAGHLPLLLLPVLLDLFLWAGPRISFQPAAEAMANAYIATWEPFAESSPPDLQEMWEQQTEILLEVVENMPAQYLPIPGIPSLLSGREAKGLPFDYTPPLWLVETAAGFIGIKLLLLLIGLILGSLYIILIAQQVRENRPEVRDLIRRLPVLTFQIGLFALLTPLLLIALLLPFLLISGMLAFLNGFLATATQWVGAMFILWVGVFTVFTLHGLLLNDRSLLGALWDSVRVVQWNMPATIFLFLLVLVLDTALTRYVWSLPEADSWLVLPGIAGRAFIATGLITATFVFYKDRYRYWKEMREELLAELLRRRAQQNRNQ